MTYQWAKSAKAQLESPKFQERLVGDQVEQIFHTIHKNSHTHTTDLNIHVMSKTNTIHTLKQTPTYGKEGKSACMLDTA